MGDVESEGIESHYKGSVRRAKREFFRLVAKSAVVMLQETRAT